MLIPSPTRWPSPTVLGCPMTRCCWPWVHAHGSWTCPAPMSPACATCGPSTTPSSLKADLARARRVAVIGGGWIGLEVAAAARMAGIEVSVLEQASLPLLRVLGPEVAAVFADLHRAHGVDLRCDATVSRLRSAGGELVGVELDDGAIVDADLAVVGVGITPNTELADAAGLAVDNGIAGGRAPAHLRPRHLRRGGRGQRLPPDPAPAPARGACTNAQQQGPVAARSMLGLDATRPICRSSTPTSTTSASSTPGTPRSGATTRW